MLRIALGLTCALLAVSGCSGASTEEVSGVVIDVTGDLTTVDAFIVRLPDGTNQVFEPAPGLRFDGTAPVSHLRDHLRSAAPITIRYEVLDDGTRIALEVSDDSG